MTDAPYKNILLEKTSALATISLNRPEALNALNRPLLCELIDVLDRLRDEKTTRALILKGVGRAFSSGADLAGGSSTGIGSAMFDAGDVLEKFYNPLMERFVALPFPVVSVVHGAAVGAGCAIALAADFVIAARSAYFLQAFIHVGLVPDAGMTWLLPRLIGRARAQAAMMLGDKISAEKAADWGLIYEAVDEDQLAARVDALAAKLVQGPTHAYTLIRRGIHAALDQSFAQALAAERVAQLEAGRTLDFTEGVAAFREKRRPSFIGS